MSLPETTRLNQQYYAHVRSPLIVKYGRNSDCFLAFVDIFTHMRGINSRKWGHQNSSNARGKGLIVILEEGAKLQPHGVFLSKLIHNFI